GKCRHVEMHFECAFQEIEHCSEGCGVVLQQGLELLAVALPPIEWIEPDENPREPFHACFILERPVFTICCREASCCCRCARPEDVIVYGWRRVFAPAGRIQPHSSRRVMAP